MNEQLFSRYLREHLSNWNEDTNAECLESEFMAGVLKVLADSISEFRQEYLEEDYYWLNKWCDLKHFSRVEQAILTYYFPLVPLIQEDALLVAQCLETIFGVPVSVLEQTDHHYEITYESLPLDQVTFDDPMQKVGGTTKDQRQNYKIMIGPLKHHQLGMWLGGGPSLWFAEHGVLPLLVPLTHRYTIEILPETYFDQCTNEQVEVFLDVNFEVP